ncbi:MAG: hypothetical protein V1934_06240 [Methanobacteriota archaeon]
MTSSNTRRNKLCVAILTSFVLLSIFSSAVNAASPTATHVYPEPAKTGEPIAINVTIDPHNTVPTSVVAYWWTSLSETRSQAILANGSAQPQNWKGQIPAQPNPCEVHYFIQIDYLYYNDNIGAQSTDTIYLPTTGNYLVSVKGDLFGNLSPLSVGIGISLMILAVGVILYAQRLVARIATRQDETATARKEKAEPGDGETDGTVEKQVEAEGSSKGAPPSS